MGGYVWIGGVSDGVRVYIIIAFVYLCGHMWTRVDTCVGVRGRMGACAFVIVWNTRIGDFSERPPPPHTHTQTRMQNTHDF